jgi:hypothetical protein
VSEIRCKTSIIAISALDTCDLEFSFKMGREQDQVQGQGQGQFQAKAPVQGPVQSQAQ